MERRPTPPLAGLVLAGGYSTRMGQDKALMLFEEQPLITRVAERLAAVADPVLIATGTTGRIGKLGYPEVTDAPPDSGPIGGLVAGLEASPHQLLAAVAVDMPHVSGELLTFLASLHDGEDAVVPIGDTGAEPLHAVYSRTALPAMSEAIAAGRYSLRQLLSKLYVREVSPAEWAAVAVDARFAFNLNRPEDLS